MPVSVSYEAYLLQRYEISLDFKITVPNFSFQPYGAGVAQGLVAVFHSGNEAIGIVVEFEYDESTVDGRHHLFKLFDSEMKKAHEEKADGESVGNHHAIVGVGCFLKIAVQAAQQVVDAVVDIRSGFASGNTVVEDAVIAALLADTVKFFGRTQVSPFLFAQARLFAVVKFVAFECFCHALKCGACPPEGRHIEIGGFLANQLS